MSAIQPISNRTGEAFPERDPATRAPVADAGLHIEVSDDIGRVADAWAALEASAPGSIYQTRRFVAPWLAAFGPSRGTTPLFIVARDTRRAPVAFLALGVEKRGPVRAAVFLGGKDSNANLPLIAPGTVIEPRALKAMMLTAAAQAPSRPDIFVLLNQPPIWEGVENPFAALRRRPSPSALYRGGLDGSRKLSKDFAKKLRQKRRWLEALGKVDYVAGADEETRDKIAAAFLEQKLQRFDDRNIDSEFGTRQSQAFMAAMAQPAGDDAPALEWRALTLDGRVIATYGGGGHRGNYHLMVNSFDAAPEIARCSPGDLLLHDILEEKRAAGFASFDLGIGEARYKNSWCDEKIELFDVVLPATARGAAYALLETARLRAKSWIKQRAWAMRGLSHARGFMRRTR